MFSRAKLFIVSYFLLLNSMFTLIKSYSVLFNKCSEGELMIFMGSLLIFSGVLLSALHPPTFQVRNCGTPIFV